MSHVALLAAVVGVPLRTELVEQVVFVRGKVRIRIRRTDDQAVHNVVDANLGAIDRIDPDHDGFDVIDRRGDRAAVELEELEISVERNLGVARTYRALDSSHERRFATMGRSLAQHVPRQSVVLAMLHSGSARYYADRLTLRWDFIEPAQLDAAVAALQQRGHPTFLLIDDAEKAEFTSRFAGASRLAALDWAPQATVAGVALYAVR